VRQAARRKEAIELSLDGEKKRKYKSSLDDETVGGATESTTPWSAPMTSVHAIDVTVISKEQQEGGVGHSQLSGPSNFACRQGLVTLFFPHVSKHFLLSVRAQIFPLLPFALFPSSELSFL